MNSVFSKHLLVLLANVVLFWLVSINTVYGQEWSDHNAHDPGIVYVQATIPSFDESLSFGSPSSIYELYSRLSVGKRLSIIGSFPVSHFSSTTRVGDVDKTAVGNPYLGLRTESLSTGFSVETGFRLPLAPDNPGVTTGLLVEDFISEAYLPETTSIKGILRYDYEHESGFAFRLGGGPNLWIQKDSDNEILLNYYTQMHLRTGNLKLGLGVTGIGVLSDPDLSLNERTDHSLGFMTSYSFSRFRPGAFVRLPLNKLLRNYLNYSIGLSASLIFSRGESRISERLRHKNRANN